MDGFADLHVHTQHSDGSLTVEQVLALARERGMRAIAISDHDTVDGVEAAVDLGPRYGVEVLPAVEASVSERSFEYHILGYGIDPRNAALEELLARGRGARREAEGAILAKFPSVGIDVTREDLLAYRNDPSRQDPPGRPCRPRCRGQGRPPWVD